MHSTKFAVGQTVWLLHDNKAMCGKISRVALTVLEAPVRPEVREQYEIKYIKPKPDEICTKHTSRVDVDANLLYATREELINDL